MTETPERAGRRSGGRFEARRDGTTQGQWAVWRIWDDERGVWVDGRYFQQECPGLPDEGGAWGEGPRFTAGADARHLALMMNAWDHQQRRSGEERP